MAEALARKYGSDVLTVASAGLTPAPNAPTLTRSVLGEINVQLGDHRARFLGDVHLARFDLIVNMSGVELPSMGEIPVETWLVEDPYGRDLSEFRRARDEIEMKVMHLILRVRTGKLIGGTKKSPVAIDSVRESSRQ
jgi:protein-tyrosine-phosphatase